jgi:hypothetical protein
MQSHANGHSPGSSAIPEGEKYRSGPKNLETHPARANTPCCDAATQHLP